MSRRVYVVTVTGELDAALQAQFDDVEMTCNRGVSRLRVVSADPSVLHGLLNRVDALGLQLIDVRPLDEMPPS